MWGLFPKIFLTCVTGGSMNDALLRSSQLENLVSDVELNFFITYIYLISFILYLSQHCNSWRFFDDFIILIQFPVFLVPITRSMNGGLISYTSSIHLFALLPSSCAFICLINQIGSGASSDSPFSKRTFESSQITEGKV